MKQRSSAPLIAPREGILDEVKGAIGDVLVESKHAAFEDSITVARESIVEVCRTLRDRFEYQQLMEIAGVDYPQRPERFEVVYHLLSVTKNHRIRVRVLTDDEKPVPSVTGLWPVAGWLEREVFDMYGVPFAGNSDLRRILTDYGFDGYPMRKDFPLTGFFEMRYSESEKRVVYEPVALPQDFRSFDFLMPWEGAQYRLPGDEKAKPQEPGAPSQAAAGAGHSTVNPKTPTGTPKTTDKPEETGGGGPADDQAQKEALKSNQAKAAQEVSKDSDVPNTKPKNSARRRPGGSTG